MLPQTASPRKGWPERCGLALSGGPSWTGTSRTTGSRTPTVIAALCDTKAASTPLTFGKASALKMCFAANTKGTTALLCAIVAAADAMDVRDDLERQWSRHGSDFAAQTLDRICRVTAKAWRFSGEMEEIASTLTAAGLPGGFHQAAADVYRRMADFKGADPLPAVEDVLEALQNPKIVE